MVKSTYSLWVIFPLFLLIINLILMASKKKNVLTWTILILGGYILLIIFVKLFISFDCFNMYAFKIIGILTVLITFIYQFILMIILIASPSKKVDFSQHGIKCDNCGALIKTNMKYCPYCGQQNRGGK